MKKFALLLSLFPIVSFAVDIQPLWGNLPPSLTQQTMQNQLQILNSRNGHTRYQLVYKGIPIWGYQLIEHSIGAIRYSGYWITGLDKELDSIEPKLSKKEIIKKYNNKQTKQLSIKKIIYLADSKAKLAYHLKYYTVIDHQLVLYNKIIDAHNGTSYKEFDSLHKARIGQGPGGNLIELPKRMGNFQYGELEADKHSLGRFDVTIKNGNCTVGNKNLEIVSLQNQTFNEELFPLSATEQKKYPTFSYPCNKQTQFINYDDSGYAPSHEGLSPVNDAMYFAQTTLDMYQQLYGDDHPIGNDLPIRVYLHIADLDNAFSMGAEYENGRIISHQQIVLGNGQYYFTPMTQTTIPHELSHNVTDNYSKLIYEGQSGGINEAFSDMTDLALRDYLNRLYPWYWDTNDWTIGREEMLSGEPLRYMEKPSNDGRSIDSAEDYRDGLNVHHSSGVFNRAFFLLAHEPGWNTQKAFQIMFDANRYYWVPNTSFDFAACGVQQAAKDRGWEVGKVIDAFRQVKVSCPLV